MPAKPKSAAKAKPRRPAKPKPSKPAAPRWSADTQAAAAEFFAKAQQTISSWIAAGCPGGPPYDLAKMVQWLLARNDEEMAAKPTDGQSPALERWRLARARGEEIDLGVKEGGIILRQDCAAALDHAADTYRAGVTSVRDELCQAFPDRAADIGRRCDDITAKIQRALVVEAGGKAGSVRPRSEPCR